MLRYAFVCAAIGSVMLDTPAISVEYSNVPPPVPGAQDEIDRGDLLDNSGHSDEAIAAYTHAIELGALQEGLRERGVAYLNAGRLSLAEADLDRAVGLNPKDGTATFDRAWLYLDQHRYHSSAREALRADALSPGDMYPVLLAYLATRHEGKDGADIAKSAQTRFHGGPWPAAVIDLFASASSPDEVQAAADSDGGEQASCEAPYYLGEYALLRGDVDHARQEFTLAKRPECRPVIESHEAGLELESLGRGSSKPKM